MKSLPSTLVDNPLRKNTWPERWGGYLSAAKKNISIKSTIKTGLQPPVMQSR